MKHRISISIVLFSTVLSCTVDQTLILEDDLSGLWEISSEAEAFTSFTMEDLAIMGGYENAEGLYGKALEEFRQHLAVTPGVTGFKLVRGDTHTFRGAVLFDDLELMLGGCAGLACRERGENKTTLTITLDRSRVAQLEELLPLLNDPALSLFNPANTGYLDEERYVNNVLGFTFGEQNLPAIRASRVILTIITPGPVIAVGGAAETLSENSVRFTAPLSRFLVPDDGIHWAVTWEDSP